MTYTYTPWGGDSRLGRLSDLRSRLYLVSKQVPRADVGEVKVPQDLSRDRALPAPCSFADWSERFD